MTPIKQPLSLPAIIRVALADDHHVVRSGIRSELERQPDMQVVGEAADGYEALSLVGRVRPHVLLLDINMPGLPGTAVAVGELALHFRRIQ